MGHLNYHHLRYFWVIAREGNLTRAARSLHVSASALSTQVRALERSLGQALFERNQKAFVLSEAGKLAFDYAETIFRAGDELLDTLAKQKPARRCILRVGAMSTLSRNIQLDFIRPTLFDPNVQLVLRSGDLRELLVQLEAYAIDVILSTEPIRSDLRRKLTSHLIAEYPVSLVATPQLEVPSARFPGNLRNRPLILPTQESSMRAAFDLLLADAGVQPQIAAEVDDMTVLRLLAREGAGVALVPPVVVRDELRDGRLREVCRVPGLTKLFYAIVPQLKFPHPVLQELIARATAATRPVQTGKRRGTPRPVGPCE